jgi:hypothetical protein
MTATAENAYYGITGKCRQCSIRIRALQFAVMRNTLSLRWYSKASDHVFRNARFPDNTSLLS